jgi:hypothetical protein
LTHGPAALRQLFELRNAVDYAWLDAEDVDADRAVVDAESFIAAVTEWIDQNA